MKKWFKLWPFVVAGLTSIVHTDGVVIPTLHTRYLSVLGIRFFDLGSFIPELTIYEIYFIAAATSALENLYSYWFWGWLARSVIDFAAKQKQVKEGIKLGKEIEHVLERKGYIDKIRDYAIRTFRWATDEKNKVMRRLKRGGYVSLFFLSATPEPVVKVVAIIFARSLSTTKALLLLLLGDLVRTAIMVFGFWDLVMKIPETYLRYLSMAVIGLLIGAMIYKKIKKRPS